MTLILNGTTGISGVDGSSGTPAFKGNDSNTGISFGTDIVTINTGGTARVTTDASGNVGFGTASPATRLQINGGTNTTSSLFIQNQLTSVVAIGNEASWLGTGSSNNAVVAAYGSNALLLATNGAERMRIDSSGNVGIGTSSATSKFFVTTASSTLYGLISQTPVVGLTAGDYVNMAYFSDSRGNNNDGLRIVNVRDSTGSGVGNWETSSYRIRRSVDQNDAATGIQEEIVFGNSLLAFNTGGSERMRINSSGNVGIGTSSPQNRLMIQDTNAGAAVAGIRVINGDATNFHRIDIGYNSGSATGYVPANAVYIDGFKGGGFGNLGALAIGTSTDAPLVFGTNSTERMRIDSSGNLLVGTTAQASSAKLSISGNVGATGGYYSHQGAGAGNTFGSPWNFFWTGSALEAWVDSTNVGNVTLVSDYRLKKNIETQNIPALERVLQIRPVTYEFKDYGRVFKADGIIREGFIAHELAEVIPSAVEGERDAENQIQSLRLDALCSVLTKAIQELKAEVDSLKAQLQGAA